MKILFCTEASTHFGHGHVMRCKNLAAFARRQGFNTAFLAKNAYTAALLTNLGEFVLPTYLAELHQGPVVIDIPGNEEPTVVHNFQNKGCRVLMLDAHGPARTLADIVCDTTMTSDRLGLLGHSPRTTYLYGFDYACLNMSFYESRVSHITTTRTNRLLVIFGGIDPLNSTARLLQALHRFGFRGPADIVLGHAPTAMEMTKNLTEEWKDTNVMFNVSNISNLMSRCSLVATKVGITMLEAFCSGKGCVMVEPTPLHAELATSLASQYAPWPAMDFGLASDEAFQNCAEHIILLLHDQKKIKDWGHRAAKLVDGQGTERVMNLFLQRIPS